MQIKFRQEKKKKFNVAKYFFYAFYYYISVIFNVFLFYEKFILRKTYS